MSNDHKIYQMDDNYIPVPKSLFQGLQKYTKIWIFGMQKYGMQQGCQIFLGTEYPNEENIPNYHYIITPNGHKLYQIAVK
jgi:hypothetical protein